MDLKTFYIYLPFILVPLISALIGWFTNFVAIKMLFHPRKKRSFLLFEFQGVFPKRQSELALKLGELFAEHLGVQSKIEDALKETINKHDISSTLPKKVKELAENFIKSEVPFLASMIPQELIDNLSIKVASELQKYLLQELDSSSKELGNRFDIKEMVKNQIEALDIEELESLLQNLLKKEFRFIELSGAALGFLIGCIQLILTFSLFKTLF